MTLRVVEIGEMLQVAERRAVPLVGGTEETPQMVETGVCLVQETRGTPPVEKKVMTQGVEKGVTPQLVGTGERPQVVEMSVILQVVEKGVTPQVGAAVASPHSGEPPTGLQVGSLLSLVVWLHIAGAPVPWVAQRSHARLLAALGMRRRTECRAHQWAPHQALGVKICYRQLGAVQQQK